MRRRITLKTKWMIPARLTALLAAQDASSRNGVWTAFLGEYSKLLIQIARRTSSDHDEAMDCYAFVIDALQRDDCRRLRAFAAEGRGKFTTWLVVVARRLSIDHHRKTHGRPQSPEEGADSERVARRRLAELVAHESDPDRLADPNALSAEASVVREERQKLLEDAIAELDLRDQLLLTLRFEDEITVEKIAPMIGAPSRFHVYRRLKSTLARLRTALERKGMTEP